jgi:hypothetical protein
VPQAGRRLTTRVLRHSPRDGLFVALAAGHGALLVALPSAPLVALGLWWNANTVSHNFIHLPFFRSRAANAAFSALLSAVLGLPQTIWRDRHLAHHADRAWRFRPSAQLALDTAAAAMTWAFMASQGSAVLYAWVIGWVVGLALCQVQGHYEHARGTVSHYGALYNRLFFNDGFHVEHHARPGVHWTALPHHAAGAAPESRWPAVLRWLEWRPLDALERVVLASPMLQRFVVARHERAFARVLGPDAQIRRATIVGGGLFPRTAIVLRRLFPDAELTVVDRLTISRRPGASSTHASWW